MAAVWVTDLPLARSYLVTGQRRATVGTSFESPVPAAKLPSIGIRPVPLSPRTHFSIGFAWSQFGHAIVRTVVHHIVGEVESESTTQVSSRRAILRVSSQSLQYFSFWTRRSEHSDAILGGWPACGFRRLRVSSHCLGRGRVRRNLSLAAKQRLGWKGGRLPSAVFQGLARPGRSDVSQSGSHFPLRKPKQKGRHSLIRAPPRTRQSVAYPADKRTLAHTRPTPESARARAGSISGSARGGDQAGIELSSLATGAIAIR